MDKETPRGTPNPVPPAPQPPVVDAPVAAPAQPEAAPHRSHTYEDDLTKAMNATEASVVQEMLTTARERESAQKVYRATALQRRWYSLLSIVFIIAASGAFAYGLWHYYRLTVPVRKESSVGVFPSTDPVVFGNTDIRQTIAKLRQTPETKEGKPTLVPIVTDTSQFAPVSKHDFFSFIEAKPTEPFATAIDLIRLGVYNDGLRGIPFLVLSVPDPQIASKEFLIAESTLLNLFYRSLGVDLSAHIAEVGKEFESTYLYNLPVRALFEADPTTGEPKPVILYGYATNNIIVITTEGEVLKAVYDTIIRQR